VGQNRIGLATSQMHTSKETPSVALSASKITLFYTVSGTERLVHELQC